MLFPQLRVTPAQPLICTDDRGKGDEKPQDETGRGPGSMIFHVYRNFGQRDPE